MREMTYRDAIREALAEEMQRQSGMVIIGEDLLPGGGTFGIHQGLGERFRDRIFEAPISEAAIVGAALGIALTGGPAVAEIMYSDFMTVCMDEIVNQAAKIRYMTGGQARVPLVIRSPYGMTKGIAAQHSQSLEAWYAHVPGLRVLMPTTPADAKGLLKSALRGEDPVIFLEHKLLYATKGLVPDGTDVLVPIGRAAIARPGDDLTIVATGLMVSRALDAAARLEQEAGVSAEVIDLRTVSPIDWDTVFASVDRTGRVLVVNEATLVCSVASEVAATIGEKRFNSLDGPVRRIGSPFVPKPSTPGLEKLAYPSTDQIAQTALEMVPRRRANR
ncbi:MAG: alpha-ketoacid dehydrogenase subunit beta [Burkholderiaceae bacterium]